jgi:hypothetical protein
MSGTSSTPMIPGRYEPNTLAHRPPRSAAAGPGAGVVTPAGASVLDAAAIADREREGGGAPSQRTR